MPNRVPYVARQSVRRTRPSISSRARLLHAYSVAGCSGAVSVRRGSGSLFWT